MSEFSDITLAVLAGGEGARMGLPKGRLSIDGEPILRFLLRRFEWPGPTLLVTAPGRAHPPGWEAFARETVDPVAGLGPLRGVQTALESAITDELLVATVDMPGLGAEELRWLAETFRDRRARRPGLVGVMTDRPGGGPDAAVRQIEPFPAALHRDAWEIVGKRLRQGRRSVHGLASEPGFVVVSSPEAWTEHCWMNLNRPEDLERFLRDRELRALRENPT